MAVYTNLHLRMFNMKPHSTNNRMAYTVLYQYSSADCAKMMTSSRYTTIHWTPLLSVTVSHTNF